MSDTPPPEIAHQGECPYCLYRSDCATYAHSGQKRPKERDISLCLRCGQFSLFDKHLNLQCMTDDDRESFTEADVLEMKMVKDGWLKVRAANIAKGTWKFHGDNPNDTQLQAGR